jgi:hypothetical protein
LVVEDRHVTVNCRVPDCFDPPEKKSFNWGKPILLGERMFHCQLRLELRGPGDGTYLRRKAASPRRVGGIECLSLRPEGETVIGLIQDSEAGRGRCERVEALVRERWEAAMKEHPEYLAGAPKTRTYPTGPHTTQGLTWLGVQAWVKYGAEAEEFVASHASTAEGGT